MAAARKRLSMVSESYGRMPTTFLHGEFGWLCRFSEQGLLYALKFLLLDLLLFGDKLLRNSGQLFKSKSTSLVVW